MKKFLLVLVLSLFVVSSAFGFNGVRKGFVLGGGLGLGMTSFKEELGSLQFNRENKFSFMTDFKIGYAPTNQVEIVYTSKDAWFSAGDSTSSTTFLHGVSTASVNYYLKPEGPTFYVGGGIGVSSISAPFDKNAFSFDNALGLGIYASGGYEFAKHFAVAVDLMYGQPKDTQLGVDYTFKGFTPRVSVIATAF